MQINVSGLEELMLEDGKSPWSEQHLRDLHLPWMRLKCSRMTPWCSNLNFCDIVTGLSTSAVIGGYISIKLFIFEQAPLKHSEAGLLIRSATPLPHTRNNTTLF